MIGLKKVILTFCICLIGVGGMGNVWASNKTIRDFHEFELWHKLLQYGRGLKNMVAHQLPSLS